jgi:hypothetical protein
VLPPGTRHSREETSDVDMNYGGDADDDDREYDYDEGEDVPQTQIILVNERDLEGARKLVHVHIPVFKILSRCHVTV